MKSLFGLDTVPLEVDATMGWPLLCPPVETLSWLEVKQGTTVKQVVQLPKGPSSILEPYLGRLDLECPPLPQICTRLSQYPLSPHIDTLSAVLTRKYIERYM